MGQRRPRARQRRDAHRPRAGHRHPPAPARDPRRRALSAPALNNRLETLRELLHAGPTAATWRALCHHLDGWTDPAQLRLGLDYAEAHLARWPEPLRLAPARWLEHPHQPRLRLARHLDLNALERRDDPLELLERPWASRLTHLNAMELGLGPDDARRLAHNPRLTSITHLNLSLNALRLEGARHLAQGAGLHGVRVLHLAGAWIEPHGARHLLCRSRMPHLDALWLGGNALGLGDPTDLTASLHDITATRLSLSDNHLDDRWAEALAQWPQCGRLRDLRRLSLANNQISDLGALALASSPGLQGLERLELRGNPISPQTRALLRQRNARAQGDSDDHKS